MKNPRTFFLQLNYNLTFERIKKNALLHSTLTEVLYLPLLREFG